MFFHQWYGMPGWGMIIFWILAFSAVVGGLIFLLVWAMRGRSGRSVPAETPEEILRERYARGEISREEYKDMLADLRE